MKGCIDFRARTRRAGIVLVVATSSVGFSLPASLPAAAVPNTDAVVEWNEHAVNALVVTGLQSPGVAGLHLAMVHGAVYDAVNAIDGGYEEYLVDPPAKRTYSMDAAAATAAHHVLVHLLPAQKAALDGFLVDTLADIPDGAAENGGVAVGKAAAKAMIEERTEDGRFGAPGFPVGDEPGEWRPTLPLFANDPAGWIRDVDPFLIRRASQFRTEGPN
ncbi:MAG: PA-phosphatase, partial [Actinomycetota bacterium]